MALSFPFDHFEDITENTLFLVAGVRDLTARGKMPINVTLGAALGCAKRLQHVVVSFHVYAAIVYVPIADKGSPFDPSVVHTPACIVEKACNHSMS